MNKKDTWLYLKALLIIPIVILKNILMLYGNISNDVKLNTIFASMNFDVISIIKKKQIFMSMDSIIIIVIFEAIFGMYIYKDFVYNSAYVFTRLRNRQRWFINKEIKLFGFASWFSFLYVLTNLFLAICNTRQNVNMGTIKVFFIMWFGFMIIMYISALLVNVLALYVDINISFVIVYAILIVLIELVIYGHHLISNTNILYNINLINPVNIFVLYIESNQVVCAIVIYYVILLLVTSWLVSKKFSKTDVGVIK